MKYKKVLNDLKQLEAMKMTKMDRYRMDRMDRMEREDKESVLQAYMDCKPSYEEYMQEIERDSCQSNVMTEDEYKRHIRKECIEEDRKDSERVKEYRSELERKKTPLALYEFIENQGKQQIELLEKILIQLEANNA